MRYLAILLTLSLLSFIQAEAPIYGYFWIRYTYNNPTTPEVEANPNFFSIDRGYVRWKAESEPVSFRGTIDITNTKDATDASDWDIRLKHAQADWTLPGVGQYLPAATLMIGLQKVHFGTVDIWEYPLIEKNLEQTEGLMSSADLGIGFHGLLPRSYGDFSFQAFNGNFYTRVTENNTNKAICGNLALTLVPGVTMKGSFWISKVPAGDTIIEQIGQSRYASVLTLRYGHLTAFGEYLFIKDGEIKGMGYMAFAEYAVTKAVSILGRCDYYDADTDTDNDAHNRIIAGLNWKVSDHLLTQVNYQIMTYENEARESEDKVMIQFKVSY